MPPPVFRQDYHTHLLLFMSWRDSQNYDKDHRFTDEELSSITPTELKRWMQLRVYGTTNPGLDDYPNEGRSSSLEFSKKAISYFMPNKDMQWNDMARIGNPTKSTEVNDLIKHVKESEARGEGRPSKPRFARASQGEANPELDEDNLLVPDEVAVADVPLHGDGDRNAQLIRELHAQNAQLLQQVLELKEEMQRIEERTSQRLSVISMDIARIAQQSAFRSTENNFHAKVNPRPAFNPIPPVNPRPAVNQRPTVNSQPAINPQPPIKQKPAVNPSPAVNQGHAPSQGSATLSKYPRNLYVLWNEYQHGINGAKAAREFTMQERGQVKYQYHRRKVFWEKVCEMVRAGWDSKRAIDKIYEVYGRHCCVSEIINTMRRDRKVGGNPALSVI